MTTVSKETEGDLIPMKQESSIPALTMVWCTSPKTMGRVGKTSLQKDCRRPLSMLLMCLLTIQLQFISLPLDISLTIILQHFTRVPITERLGKIYLMEFRWEPIQESLERILC